MSDVKTSEHFHGQDEYHRAYFHDIDAPAPLKKDRVDPNLPTLDVEKVVDPDLPEAPARSGREESGTSAGGASTKDAEPKSAPSKTRSASGSTK